MKSILHHCYLLLLIKLRNVKFVVLYIPNCWYYDQLNHNSVTGRRGGVPENGAALLSTHAAVIGKVQKFSVGSNLGNHSTVRGTERSVEAGD